MKKSPSTARRRNSRPPKVALLVEMSNAYARGLLEGIEDYIRSYGPWNVYLAERGRGDLVPPWLHGWNGDGVIARIENPKIAKALDALRIPVVDVSSYLFLPDVPEVTTDAALFAGTSGTVSISGGVTANALTFNTTGYLIQSSTLTLNGATPTITTGSGVFATISSVIAGAAGLTNSGSGVLTLSAVNIFTGGLTISSGTVAVSANTALGGTSGTAGAISLNGGTLQTLGFLNGAVTVNPNISINFNGGTLRANLSSTTFMTGLTAAYVLGVLAHHP